LRWSFDAGETDTGLRMAGALWRFWQMRDHLAEGRRWTDELLGLPGASARTAARGKALAAAGSLAYWLRDAEAVRGPYKESLAIYRELEDRRGEAEATYNLGFASFLTGDLRGAKELFERASEMYRQLDDPIRLAHGSAALAMVAYREGDLEATGALVDEARTTFRTVGDLWGIALTSGQLAALALKRGDYERCRAVSLESLEANERLGNTLGMAVSFQALAVTAIRLGRPEAGVRLAGVADRIREVTGGEAPPAIVGLEDPLEVATASLTEQQIAALLDEGRAMSMVDAMAYARGAW
jgi:tetratricopeptide (TPR) repeat protein